MATGTTSSQTVGAPEHREMRRRTAASAPSRERRFPGSTLALVVLALIIGAVIGAVVARQRLKAQETVASVNGLVIGQYDFYHRLESEAGVPVLQKMVLEDLQMQFAKRMNVYPSDAVIDKQLQIAAKDPAFYQGLAASNHSVDDYKRHLRLSLIQNALMAASIEVSDADVRRFYEHNSDPRNRNALYYRPPTAQIAVIVTNQRGAALNAMQQLRHGIGFPVVAQTFSIDESKRNGGLLGQIARGRTNATRFPGLEDTIFNMNIGQRVGPRQIAGKWWIMQCVDRKPAMTRPFDQVRDLCRQGAAAEKGVTVNRTRVKTQFEEFQKASTIRAFWSRYSRALELRQ